MTIKQHGGIFGRNPTFNEVSAEALGIGGGRTGTVAGVEITTKFCVKDEDNGVLAGLVHANNTTAASPAVLYACRSRGTLNAPTVVQDNDSLASIIVAGNDGTDLAIAARIDFEVDGTPGSNDMPGRIVFKTTPDGTQIPVDAMEIDSAQNVKLASGNLIIGTSGKGIDFSATAGTGTSELFDDYEEGTWTPSVIGATSGSMSFGSVALARYTKVGRIVSITLYMTSGDFAAHTVSGNVLIQGLPYTATSAGAGVISVAFCNLTTADEADITVSGYVEATSLRLLKGSSTSAVTGADLLSSGTNGAIMLSIVYETGA